MNQYINRRLPLLLLFVLIVAFSAAGAETMKASLIIVGPGDPMYTYWGHIGIAVEKPIAGENLFYDFGNFSFNSDNFYGDFAMGRMMYLGYVVPTDYFLSYTLRENRDVAVYPLNLGTEELEELDNVLRWWVLPENREYLYEYFQNNCSTIIRDILDSVTRGELKRYSAALPDLTFRHYARTGADPSFLSEILLHYLLGANLDKPITGWDKMFLPQAVADLGSQLVYTGRDGVSRRLVGEERILYKSDRPPVPDQPRILWPTMLLTGILAGILWILAGRATNYGNHLKSLRVAAFTYRTLITLIIGLAGLMLGFLTTFTDHAAAYDNINLWPVFPTVLAGLVLLFVPSGRNTEAGRRRELTLSWLWTINLAGLMVSIFLKVSGLSIQDAYAFWAFFGPLNLAASRAGLWLSERLSAGSSRNRSI